MDMNANILFHRPFRLRMVVFDFDGTLTAPGSLNFRTLRRQLNCPEGQGILEFINDITDPRTKARALADLRTVEIAAARRARPSHGAEKLIDFIKSRGLPIGIISRNSRESIATALQRFDHLRASDFDAVLSRDDAAAPKPNPAGLLQIADRFGVAPADMLVIGDFVYDMEAGAEAGCITVYLNHGGESLPPDVHCDYAVSRLLDAVPIIEGGLPLKQGKLPNEYLQAFISPANIPEGALIIKPGIGEDTAAADISDDEVLVLKSDPITFATDSVGHYAVLVNANDIATSGATPRWFLTTLLFPRRTTPSEIQSVMHELSRISRHYGIILCGGHTEITDAVSRPVVVGAMAGTIQRRHLIDKRKVRRGDVLLMTKKLAVEGTAIIAREFESTLLSDGLAAAEINACKDLIRHIGILREARIAVDVGGVSAMHDVTEGGLATAVQELSVAGGHRIKVFMDTIPCYPQTVWLCRHFSLSPLGLIGSGTLLICCRPEKSAAIMQAIQSAGTTVTPIGEILAPGHGIQAVQNGRDVRWPRFEVDELTRLFTE